MLGSRRVDLLFWGWPEGINALQQQQENKELQGERELLKQIPKQRMEKEESKLPSMCSKIQFCLFYFLL